MSRQSIDTGTYRYVVADDDRAAGDLLPQALLRCRVIDELTGEAPQAPLALVSTTRHVTPRVGEGGLCGLVGRPRDIASALLQQGGLSAAVHAPGYLRRDLTPAIDDARRMLTAAAAAGATTLAIDRADPAPRHQFGPGRGVLIERASMTSRDQFTTVADITPPPAASDVPLADPVEPGRVIGARITGVPIALPDQPLHHDAVLTLLGSVRQRVGTTLLPAPSATVMLTGVWWTYPESIASPPLAPQLCAVEPALRFAYATGVPVQSCTLNPVGAAAKLQAAVFAGAEAIMVAPSGALNPAGGDMLRLGQQGEPEEEIVITAGLDKPTNPEAPALVRLSTPTGMLHRSGEPVQTMQAMGVAPVGAIAREGLPGDQMLFAPGLDALPTISWIIVGQASAAASVHRAHQLPVAAAHLIAPDAITGRFAWPPLGRLAQLRIVVSQPPLVPVTVDLALNYATQPTLNVILA